MWTIEVWSIHLCSWIITRFPERFTYRECLFHRNWSVRGRHGDGWGYQNDGRSDIRNDLWESCLDWIAGNEFRPTGQQTLGDLPEVIDLERGRKRRERLYGVWFFSQAKTKERIRNKNRRERECLSEGGKTKMKFSVLYFFPQ